MNIVRDLESLDRPLRNPVVTIGNFDGVHRGHLSLFNMVKQRAAAIGGQSAVVTFEPHPLKVVKKGNGPALITSMDQKLILIWNAGIEVIFCIPFTLEFAAISAEAFVEDILVRRIRVREIVVGYDYSFGRDRRGNTEFLQAMGRKLGFTVHLVGPVHVDRTVVSSTSIRRFVQEGNLAEAKRLLGRDFELWGTVVKGAGRGARLLGYPTANVRPSEELVPKTGVYAVSVVVDDDTHYGVTNVGYNPTFGDVALSVETHILDFLGDLLGKRIRIHFLQRIREEKTFHNARELTDQIARDIQVAREFFGLHKAGTGIG